MRISITYGVLLALSLTAVASDPSPVAPRTRTVAQVQADIVAMTTQISSLNATFNRFPTILGPFIDAPSLYLRASNMEAAANKATADIKSIGPVSESDANGILQRTRALRPIMIAALEEMIAKKPDLDRLQLPLLLPAGVTQTAIRGSLCNLRAATTNFGNALVASAPDHLKDDGAAVLADLEAEFDKALLAYAV